MAAHEYYMGTQSAAELSSGGRPNLHPPQQAQQPFFQHPPAQPYQPNSYNTLGYAPTPPPTYSPYSLQPPQNQQLGVHSPQPNMASYPTSSPVPQHSPQPNMAPYRPNSSAPQHFPTQPPKNGYLGAPMQPIRSHSQPARVHFADQESDSSTEGSDSDSGASPRRHRHHRHRRHSHSRRNDSDSDSDYSDMERKRARDQKHKTHRKGHRDRDTFLGAGAGAVIGDSIFPGLGTAAGLLLGGIGGRKYADRSRSEESSHRHRHRDGYRSERY